MPWYPFADKAEWELGKWMVLNLGQHQMDDLLKLDLVGVLVERPR